MSSKARVSLLSLTVVALLNPAPVLAQYEPSAQIEPPEPARVRFLVTPEVAATIQDYDGRPMTGRVVYRSGGCMQVLPDSLRAASGGMVIGSLLDPPRVPTRYLQYHEVASLWISSIYHTRYQPGAMSPRYAPGASTEGEEWEPFDLSTLSQSHCRR